jgi:hypothetical protein
MKDAANAKPQIFITNDGWFAYNFEETRFDPLRFLLYQVEHGVDLPLAGQHLTMIGYPLL